VALERKVGGGAVGGVGGVEGAAVGGGEARACRRKLYRAFTSVQDRCEISKSIPWNPSRRETYAPTRREPNNNMPVHFRNLAYYEVLGTV
jgi:hypothetical protein